MFNYTYLNVFLGTTRPLPGKKYEASLKLESPPVFSDSLDVSAGFSQDHTALPPCLLKDASSAFEEGMAKKTSDKQDMDTVLTLPDASGHNAGGCSGIMLDGLELSGERSGDGAWQDNADTFVAFSMTEPEEDSAPKPSTEIDDSHFSTSGSEAFSSFMKSRPDGASQSDLPSRLFTSSDEVAFSGDSVWTITSDDDQPFTISGESEETQAMTVSQSVKARSEKADSNFGAGSQSGTEIVDIDSLPITVFSDAAKAEITGSGEMEDEMHEDYSDKIGDFPDSEPKPQVGCSGECGSTVRTSPIEELIESLLLVPTTTMLPETQIHPPASQSVIKVHKNSSKAGNNSSLYTDISDGNTSTGAEVTESDVEVIRVAEQLVSFVTKFLGSIDDGTVNVNMTPEEGSTELVDLPPGNNRGATLLHTHNASAEGNNTILPKDS